MNLARLIFNILLPSQAGIIQPTLTDKINAAAGLKAPGYRRNCVDNKAKVLFASLHCFFSLLPVGDVLHGAKHADWLARFVTHNFITDMHKSYVAIRTHESEFHIKKPAALQRFV